MKALRFFLPRLEYMLLIALFWSIVSAGPKLLNVDGDLPRHLLVGRLTRETRSVSLTDTFSFRTVGFPSFPHEWLSQVLLSVSNELLGLSGVILLTAIIVTLTWGIVYYEDRRRSKSIVITLFIIALGMGVSMIHVLPRPHIFTYVFTALWIVVLEKTAVGKPHTCWLLPVVMLLWVNMHGMFVLGVILWGIYVTGSFMESPGRSWFRQPGARALLLGGVLSIPVTFLSPSGVRIWEAITALGSNSYITSRIPEYQSANFHSPATWLFILLLIITIAGFARGTKPVSWTHILATMAFTAMALYTSRMIPIFAIVVAPIAAASLGEWVNAEFAQSPWLTFEKNLAAMNTASNGAIWFVALFLTLIFVFQSGRTIDPQGKGNVFDEKFFPVRAVTWLNAHPQAGRMINDFDWGGYLLLKLDPRQQIFMDGHTHIYGEALTREYETVITLAEGWQDILEKYQIRWAIVRTGSRIGRGLEGVGWQIIYQDDTAIVLKRP